jgi:hypothetical protein
VITEGLPVLLQLALLLFGVALPVYLWDLDVSAAEVVLVITSIGLTLNVCIVVAATVYSRCPFQTPLSNMLRNVLSWAKELTLRARLWLRRRIKTFTRGTKIPNNGDEDPTNNDHIMTLSNPAFWRNGPLFTPPVPKDIAASAGFWLLENSTDFSAASAVAAVFPKFQWPSHCSSQPWTVLLRLRDTYVECFQAPKFEKSVRLQALQSAAAYYVLYHTQLIWSISNNLENALEVMRRLSRDLFLRPPNGAWGGDGVFEHLLRIKDRSEPVTSAWFLSYIAPYWFCGDSDSAVKLRPDRLPTLYELIEVLEESRLLNVANLTNCVLCAGAAMDFPLHPEDLIRVDKRCVPFPLYANSRVDRR